MILELGCTIGAVMTVYSVRQFFVKITEWEREVREVTDQEIVIGYQEDTKVPIVVSMGITPHMMVAGLSQTGKTRMIEYAVKGKNVVLLNVFEDDFTSIRARRIIGIGRIKGYLKSIVTEPYKREKTLYLVIDELLVLCTDKEITQLIIDVLAIGRHYNIYVIGITQNGAKEVVKFKDLFNVRVCFRMVEESAYRTVLGYSPERKYLANRQFHVYSDQICFGYTYDV